MTIIVIHSGILRRRDLRVSDVLMDGQLLTDASQDLIDRTSDGRRLDLSGITSLWRASSPSFVAINLS